MEMEVEETTSGRQPLRRTAKPEECTLVKSYSLEELEQVKRAFELSRANTHAAIRSLYEKIESKS